MAYWLFQTLPARYDLRKELAPGREESWPLKQHVNLVKEGDWVYLWQGGGKDAALHGWGEVMRVIHEPADDPQQSAQQTVQKRAKPGDKHRAYILYRTRFNKPILKTEIKAVPGLGKLSVIRQPQATNFIVTDDEIEALNSLIRAHGFPAPGDPEPTSADTAVGQPVSLGEIESLGLSPTLQSILHEAQKLLSDAWRDGPINSSSLLFGMLTYGYQNSGNRNVATFLAEEVVFPDPERFIGSRDQYYRRGREQSTSSETHPLADHVSATVQSLFNRANDIVAQANPNRPIATRHLLAALLTYPLDKPQPGALTRLEELEVDVDKLRQRFRDLMVRERPQGERDFWRRLLRTPRQPRSQISRFNADLATGNDCLGVTRDARAMARLMASKALQPPLSIGLFGNWGSGKSFFMGKIKQAVEELTNLARKEKEPAYQKVYWPNVVQIEFNAWHYVDANLWASLVSHVFEELSRWGKDRPGPIQSAKRRAMQRLKVASEARAAALSHLKQARKARVEARKIHQARWVALENDETALANVVALDVWKTVQDELANMPEEDKQHLKAVGIPVDEVKEAADRVYGAVTELGTLAGRARAVWGLMLTGGDAIPALKLAAVVAAVGLLVALLVSWKSESMGVVLGLAGQVAGVVGGMARWVGKNAASVSAALEPLERLRTQLDTSLKKAEQEKARKIAELDKRLERVKTAYADAARNLDEAERKVQAAKMGVNEALSGRLITRFIEQRVASNDYRKHLGIVAMIRDDFATLSNMIGEHNTAQLKQEPGVPDGLTEPTLATESVKAPKDLGINRIILYIDDLDRCRPERVVEVLQAIHLLLAFPLFAVVVGVDARWLSSSLQSQYQHMLIPPEPAGGNGNGSSNSQAPQQSASAATPDDYLEKIFQVPYWIKHMEDKACRDLINSLVERDLETREDQQVDAKPSPALTKPIVGGEPIEKPSTLQPKKSTATTPKTRTTTADISPEDLRLDEAEVEAMKQLSLIIGRSPRVAKRFVNTYRLIKAALPPDERDAFVGLRGETGTFRYPMLLLAVATGTPDLAPYFFHQICRPNRDRPFGELGAAVTTAPTRDGVAEVKRLREFLDSADSEPFKSLPAGELARWVGRVAQFSFDVGGGLRSGLSEVGGPTISMP